MSLVCHSCPVEGASEAFFNGHSARFVSSPHTERFSFFCSVLLFSTHGIGLSLVRLHVSRCGGVLVSTVTC
ncbi:hypothetical protein M404DRAFT_1008501 [Pisolithus tinctorius Marx 270]|uniref:Uncharacterized protein n=1 Tax=Pisolithus tinctorius Marx 270 TaxID=870435 RepID=A0A0C3NET6_PISTI|nr:hypothetical protein M404DRAFT_1008501 [Pisolithus tinctorius Marx 270]